VAWIESSPVWDTSCLTEIIYDFINSSFMREVSQTGDDSTFAGERAVGAMEHEEMSRSHQVFVLALELIH